MTAWGQNAKCPNPPAVRPPPVDYDLRDGNGYIASRLRGITLTLISGKQVTNYVLDFNATNSTYSDRDDSLNVSFLDQFGTTIRTNAISVGVQRGSCGPKPKHVHYENKISYIDIDLVKTISVVHQRAVGPQHECH
jgi:hypothetical protein